MTQYQKECIEKELKWQTEWYQKNRDSGFDKQAEAHWHTIKGMQKILAIMGHDTECDPDTMNWTITNCGEDK